MTDCYCDQHAAHTSMRCIQGQNIGKSALAVAGDVDRARQGTFMRWGEGRAPQCAAMCRSVVYPVRVLGCGFADGLRRPPRQLATDVWLERLVVRHVSVGFLWGAVGAFLSMLEARSTTILTIEQGTLCSAVSADVWVARVVCRSPADDALLARA